MTSPPDDNRLLDLLYGELSPEQEEQLRREIHEDEELAEAWRDLQAMHGDVEREVPEPEPMPDEIRSDILQKASRTDDEAPARAPAAPTDSRSFWGRMASSKSVRAGLSAVLMAALGGVVYFALFNDAGVQYEVDTVSVESTGSDPTPAADDQKGGAKKSGEKVADLADEQVADRPEKRAGANKRRNEEPAGETAAESGSSESRGDGESRLAEGAGGNETGSGVFRSAGESAESTGSAEAEASDESSALLADDSGAETNSGAAGRMAEPERRARASSQPEAESSASDEESDPESLLSSAREAHRNDEVAEAYRLIEQLFEEERVRELEDEKREEARRLRREIEEARQGPDESSDINIIR